MHMQKFDVPNSTTVVEFECIVYRNCAKKIAIFQFPNYPNVLVDGPFGDVMAGNVDPTMLVDNVEIVGMGLVSGGASILAFLLCSKTMPLCYTKLTCLATSCFVALASDTILRFKHSISSICHNFKYSFASSMNLSTLGMVNNNTAV